nr:MAG TPA: hypothetical protein [Caudoviricetes sp.]
MPAPSWRDVWTKPSPKRKPLRLSVQGLRFCLLVVSVRMRWSSYQTACR